ncbi:MAG: Xylose isomerase-like TIM barrel [bacterium ADurb.Bin429]|nr:MAG: Xylose isomerase-like TIM barrel [bacterium ADurb.Bin429]
MKFGTQLTSVGRRERREALRHARTLGCEGLEVDLPVAWLHDGRITREELREKAAALRDDFAAEGMAFISLTPGLLLGHVEAPEVVRATCETAEQLGVRQIRLFTAPHVRWGGPNSTLAGLLADFDGTRDSRYWMERNARELARMLDMSADYDVRFVFELHHGYVVNSASAALRLLEPFPANRVGILMDPGNMVFEGNEGWRNSVQLMGDYLAYIHCKNAAYWYEDGRWVHRWASLRDGIANYPEIITALKDSGFRGYLSIEDLRRDLTPEERVGEGIAYLKALVASPERVMPA